MQPKRLLQVASLLLLSAAVLGQVETSAAMPAEIRVAMTFCDPDGVCTWGTRCSNTATQTPPGLGITNCVVCQTGATGAPGTVCRYCAAGFFLQGGRCFRCPQGAFCGGASPNPNGNNVNVANFRCDWANGVVTDADGRWAAPQCNTCTFGYGSFGPTGCTPCTVGTAKNQVGTKECDLCLDGLFSNSDVGATDCVSRFNLPAPFTTPDAFCNDFLRDRPNTPGQPVLGATVGLFDDNQNSCVCPPGTTTTAQPVQYNGATLAPGRPWCRR